MTRTLAAALLAACIGCEQTGPGTTPADSEIRFPVPEFSFTERGGQTITNADLRGKVWIASFVFTRCTGPCPQMSATVARLQGELADLPDLRFVTFTIDPDRDQLTDLKQYADSFRADPARWLFLTGPEQAMHKFAVEGFKLMAARSSSPSPKPGEEFDHSSRLAVVDKQGVIRGYYDGMAPDRPDGKAELEESLTKLKAKVQALLAE